MLKMQMLLSSLLANYKLFLLTLSILAAIIVYSATYYYGIALSADSVVYFAASRSILDGTGILTYDGTPLITHPPLYPLILAIFSYLSDGSALISAQIVNAILFSIIVLLGTVFIKKRLSSSIYLSISGALAIVFSRPLFAVSTWAWSELFFILTNIIVFICAYLYLEKRTILHLILFTFSVVLSFYTRYAGLTLILWGAFLILLLNNFEHRKKIFHLSIFISLSIISVGLWLYRTIDELISNRTPSASSLSENLRLFFNVIFEWLIPGFQYSNNIFILTGVFFVLFLILAWFLWPVLKSSLHKILPILFFIVLYSSILIIASTLNQFDPIDDRLLVPVYIPLVFVFTIIFDAVVKKFKKSSHKLIVNIFLSCIFLFWLIFQIQFVVENVKVLRSRGQGYTNRTWRKSETISYLVKNQISKNTHIYTNSPDIAYILADISAKKIPLRESVLSIQLSKLKGKWPVEDDVKLIWFSRVDKEYLLEVKELSEIAYLDTVICLKDGVIYSVKRKSNN